MGDLYGTCSVSTCDRSPVARSLCLPHYKRWQRHGTPEAGMDSDPWLRFLNRRTITDDGCWVISGADRRTGYAKIKVDGTAHRAHRWAYERLVGPIPDGLVLDHLCRNRACANPDHMEPVTFRENVLRGEGPTAANARKTECPVGHSLADPYIVPSTGSRMCRICIKERG